MKAWITAAAILAALSAQPVAARSGNVCLTAHLIDHTHVVNATTIDFHMKDGKIWQNHLRSRCNGLNFHGFRIIGHEDELCGGQGIAVIETQETCQLGNFTAYMPPQQVPADK